ITWDFTDPGDTFLTTTTVSFNAAEGAETFIECAAIMASRVTLNGSPLDAAAALEHGRIELKGLKARNSLTIDAEFAYRTDGQGIHRFIDPEDGETYLYSQFAANDARAAFPCFDQPDIRATFAIAVVAPAHWVVVSNSPTPTPEPVPSSAITTAGPAGEATQTSAQLWVFPTTVALPTYVAAVVAGPYAYEEGSITSRKGQLSARVYGRKNLKAHLDADEMIATVQAGLDLYERVFDTEYPYDKYDQVFVPEYNLGAMENVGCVTFSEDRLLFRSRPTDALRESRRNIQLHELSHMWFGNLVTMRWWDDLWLNESFAEFVGTWATEQTTEWKDAWVTFGAGRKSVAYIQDQLPTTHAIVTEVADTEATVSAFDMITYAKGASALKQLAAYVGEESFFAGVASYLKRYALGNASLAEFLAEVEAAAGRPLDAWASAWLQSPGVTTLRPVIDTDPEGVMTSFAIAEDVPAQFPVHRPHSITIAGYTHVDGAFARTWAVDAEIGGPLTGVSSIIGKTRPDLLLVNDGDRSYAKAQLDDVSIETIEAHLGDLTEAMPLASVLDAAWHMCRDAALSAECYINAVLVALPNMTNSETAESHIRTLAIALSRYVPPARTVEVTAAAAERLWTIAQNAGPGTDRQLQALKAYARLAATPEQAARLADLLDGALSLSGLNVDADLGWDLLTGLTATGSAAEGSISGRLATDPGAAGQRRAAGARAAVGTI
ncbi:MAG: aminopeptidase N, partial [Demequinaceae bacterium]|nr:aminopeptidase N [Demequinaceae bacterium]